MIKNFVYLDVEKLHSLSSQVFEGITEYILNESSTESEKSESQKGPVGSGRVLGEILKQSGKTSERKYLDDYSYTLFEKKLIEDGLVFDIDAEKKLENISDAIEGRSFIKIKAKAIFNDINSINDTLKNFNKIGKALTHITNFKEISAVKEQIDKARSNTKDRNQRSKLKQQFKAATNISKLAKESGLQQDQGFLDDLSLVLNYGFQDQLEIQMKLCGFYFSANLKRENLRENESLIIRKYSRQTEVEFVIFGVITQYQRTDLDDVEEVEENEEYESIKEALMNLVSHLSNVESTFTGRLSNEVIIDPIALYTEL
jgi:predicted house-cleaning noncanonical NTP pyrophosphatase (MazG superfamily)